MDFHLNAEAAEKYTRKSQKARVMSEKWMEEHGFCPRCGAPLDKLKNNTPAADFRCRNNKCGKIFELKCKKGKFGHKIPGGAYNAMIARINNGENPDLLMMNYSVNLMVTDLAVVPNFFFTTDVIEKRKPLCAKASRAGWVGCNILIDGIPRQGKLPIIMGGAFIGKEQAISGYRRLTPLETRDIERRGWLFDVLRCVNAVAGEEFCLADIYAFEEKLMAKHAGNRHIKDKIRQQLQILRDYGVIEFSGRGRYRKKICTWKL